MMLFKVGDEVRVNQPTNLFHSELGKVVSIDHVKLTYKVIFHRGGSDVYTCFDLILVERQEEKTMKLKVGDRVQVIATRSGFCGDKGNVIENDGTDILPIEVGFDDGDHVCWFYENDLKVLHEEETSMKFKVGDKVKVKDSWFEHDGQVGVVVRTDNYEPYNYSVKFDVEGDNERYDEHFRGDSLELEKQSFTKSDLKTGMGVVLRDGSKGHVLLDTSAGDVIRFINRENNEWMSTRDYDSEMRDSDMKSLDIIGVYSSRLAYCYVTERLFTASNQVFKREEPKTEPEPTKMTMKEINEHFGKPIEIIE